MFNKHQVKEHDEGDALINLVNSKLHGRCLCCK